MMPPLFLFFLHVCCETCPLSASWPLPARDSFTSWSHWCSKHCLDSQQLVDCRMEGLRAQKWHGNSWIWTLTSINSCQVNWSLETYSIIQLNLVIFRFNPIFFSGGHLQFLNKIFMIKFACLWLIVYIAGYHSVPCISNSPLILIPSGNLP